MNKPNQDTANLKIDTWYDELRSPEDCELIAYGYNQAIDKIEALIAQARIDGMNAAKSRVLRRTEIPRDAKNPTRDHIVILGEEIAGFIDADIAELKREQENG